MPVGGLVNTGAGTTCNLLAKNWNGAATPNTQVVFGAGPHYTCPGVGHSGGRHLAFNNLAGRGVCNNYKDVAGVTVKGNDHSAALVIRRVGNSANGGTTPDECLYSCDNAAVNNSLFCFGIDGASGCFAFWDHAGVKQTSTIPATANTQAVVIKVSGTAGATTFRVLVSGHPVWTVTTATGHSDAGSQIMRLGNTGGLRAGVSGCARVAMLATYFASSAITDQQQQDVMDWLVANFAIQTRCDGVIILDGDSYATGENSLAADTIAMGLAAALPNHRIIALGMGGSLVSEAAGRISRALNPALRSGIAAGAPWMVVELLGMNHVWNSTETTPAATVISQMQALARKISGTGAKVATMTVPPCYVFTGGGWTIGNQFVTQEPKRQAINAGLRSMRDTWNVLLDLETIPDFKPPPAEADYKQWLLENQMWRQYNRGSNLPTSYAPFGTHAGPGDLVTDGIHLGIGQVAVGRLLAPKCEEALGAAVRPRRGRFPANRLGQPAA